MVTFGKQHGGEISYELTFQWKITQIDNNLPSGYLT